MMRYFTVLVSISMLFLISTSHGQQNVADKRIISGHFEMEKNDPKKGVTEHINVNYSLSPAPFTDVLNMELSTPDPVLFTADIVDPDGRKQYQWKPAAISYRYNENFDISKLAAGKYKLNIYCAGYPGLLKSIPFQKGNN